MELHILLAGVEFGPYTEDKARQLLDEGFLSATDPAKRLDETNWLPLSDVLGAVPVATGSGGSETTPAPLEFRSLAAALKEEEDPVEEFHAPLPPGSEIAKAVLPEGEEAGSDAAEPEDPEPAPSAPPVAEEEPSRPKGRLSVTGPSGLTPPSVVAASRVTRAIAPRPSLEPLSSPPPTAPLPVMPAAGRTTGRLARLAREREEAAATERPKSAPVASEEIKSSFAAALAKTRSVSGDTAPLPAPARAAGKAASKPPEKAAPDPKPKPESETEPAPPPEAEEKPAEAISAPSSAPRTTAPPQPSAPAAAFTRPAPVRTASLSATGTAPLTTLTVNSRAKRPTVTGSLLAKEALLKAREKSTGILASRVTTSIAPVADFKPEAAATPRKRAPVKLARAEEPSAPAAAPATPQRKAIRLTGHIPLTGDAKPGAATTAPAPSLPEIVAPALEPAAETPAPRLSRATAETPAPPVQLREKREGELAKPKTSTTRKAIRLTGPISLPGRATQPTRPAPLSRGASDTGPLTTSFPRSSARLRTPMRPALESTPAAMPAIESVAKAPEPLRIPPAPEPPTAEETRLPDRRRMSLRSLIHPAEIAATTSLAAETLTSGETRSEPEPTPGGQRVSSGSLKITGALRAPAPPRIPIRLSSPSGESGRQGGAAEPVELAEPKPSAPVPEEELVNRPASGKIPVHEFPTEGVRVRTRRLTAKVPLPEAPSESIIRESPARQAPPPLLPRVELPGPPVDPSEVEAASAPTAPTDEIVAVSPAPVETQPPAVPPVEPERPVAEPPAPATKPEKVRLRKPVKLELTSRKIPESGKLSLEAFSKLASQDQPGGPATVEASAPLPVVEESPTTATESGFAGKRLEEAAPLIWTTARRAVPFPLEWIFYGIIALGLVAGVPTAYLLVHHARKASPEGAAPATAPAAGETPAASAAPPASAPPPSSAETAPSAATPPTTAAPATAAVPTILATNAAPAPVPPPSSPAQDAARQASAFVSDGTLKYQHGDFDGAISAFNQALTLDPKSSDAFFNRGIAKAAHDDLDGAVADYSQALDLNPNLAQAYYYRGLARHSKEELDGAISDYNSAVRIDPKNALAFFNRGLIRMQKDDIDGAIVDSTQALELDPKLIQSYYDRGLGRLAKGASDGALEDMKTFTQNAPQDGYTDYARLYIWLIQTQRGELAEANKELESAMNTSWNGKSDDMVTRIGEFLLGQISESDLIKASGSSMPAKDQGQRCEAWYFIGMRKLEAGDKEAAAEALRKCVDTQKTDYCEYILAQEALKKLTPGSAPERATLAVPRSPASSLPDPGTMAPPDTTVPQIPH